MAAPQEKSDDNLRLAGAVGDADAPAGSTGRAQVLGKGCTHRRCLSTSPAVCAASLAYSCFRVSPTLVSSPIRFSGCWPQVSSLASGEDDNDAAAGGGADGAEQVPGLGLGWAAAQRDTLARASGALQGPLSGALVLQAGDLAAELDPDEEALAAKGEDLGMEGEGEAGNEVRPAAGWRLVNRGQRRWAQWSALTRPRTILVRVTPGCRRPRARAKRRRRPLTAWRAARGWGRSA
jgi:hypothetical protein